MSGSRRTTKIFGLKKNCNDRPIEYDNMLFLALTFNARSDSFGSCRSLNKEAMTNISHLPTFQCLRAFAISLHDIRWIELN